MYHTTLAKTMYFFGRREIIEDSKIRLLQGDGHPTVSISTCKYVSVLQIASRGEC